MFEYRRTWFANLMRNVSAVAVAFMFVVAMVFIALQLPFMGRIEFWCFIAVAAAIGLALCAAFTKYLYWDWTLRRDFIIKVTPDCFECECPIPSLGDSFNLLFEEIREIRIENAHYDSDRFVVLDQSGLEHEVSLSHGVPVYRILNAIHDVSPSTTIIDYGRAWKSKPAMLAT